MATGSLAQVPEAAQTHDECQHPMATLWALCRYKDAPEPDIAGHSVTVKPTPADLAALHQEAEETWTPAFADLIKVGPSSAQGCWRFLM